MVVVIDLRGSSANTENLLRICSGPANTPKETCSLDDAQFGHHRAQVGRGNGRVQLQDPVHMRVGQQGS